MALREGTSALQWAATRPKDITQASPGLAPSCSVLSGFQSLQQLANVVVVIFVAVQRVRFRGGPELPSIPLDVGLVNMNSAVAFGTDAEQLVEAACV